MKLQLNLVAATMSVLGLISISGPVAAETNAKHKHHKRHHARHEMMERRDYKDYKDMAVQPPVCTISPYMLTMDEMTQNVGRAMPNPCNPGWFNRIHVSGGINLDFGKFGNRDAGYMGENYERFSINDVYLNFTADVNEWVKAFASLSFETATINEPSDLVTEYSAAYANNITGGSANLIQMEQAFITVANMNEMPIFLQLGKQFQDYSRYMIHPITRSMTQVLSETLATSAKIGFMANGFNGSASVFDNPIIEQGDHHKDTNFVIALGYDQESTDLGFDLGVSYINDMIATNDIAYIINQTVGAEPFPTNGYRRRVAGIAAYGDVNSGPFAIGARYTQALKSFNVMDLPDSLNPAVVADGAKPWAAGIQAGFDFQAWDRGQNIYVGWQTSHDAVALGIPQHRWLAGWDVRVWDNAHVGIEWDFDQAYSASRGGNDDNTNLVTIRAGVQFS